MFAMSTRGAPSFDQDDTPHHSTLSQMAERALAWPGPIVIAAHVDPDGDALGSSLALLRALRQLGKGAVVVMEPPHYLSFLVEEGELTGELATLEEGTLLFVLDSADRARVAGAPLAQAALVFNIDHHGTNDRFGDLAVVEPSMAACAMLVKELVDALGAEWTPEIATPCLTGILTDTGNFRFGNTDRTALSVAGELLDYGVDYAGLTDRLQWRQAGYFRLLGEVMRTVDFHLGGLLVTADVTDELRERAGASPEESDDFVGLIRYAEGTKVAALFKQREGVVKISVRTRDGVSAQRICLELGGGGHAAAAGAAVTGTLEEAKVLLLQATERELKQSGGAITGA